MHEISSFGRWVKQLRAALDLTQEALAAQVGCATQTIQKIERGVRRPSQQIAERLAEALQVLPDQRRSFMRAARATAEPELLDSAGALAGQHAEPARAPADISALLSHGASLPVGTVTFLFADIVGSTRLWEQHPDAMLLALARYDTLMRAAIAVHGGTLFRTVGDAFCTAFASPTAALAAALAAQRALHAESWGVVGPLRVRMALHTGAVEVREGSYLGQPFNRVARLLAVAQGGQIVLSRATSNLVAEHLPSAVTLRDLGEHHLKDLSRPEQIFQPIAPGLPADFPPLTTHDHPPARLPAPPTSFVGRADEMAELARLLADPACRLLTLVGPGGVGKTRLALEASVQNATAFADGVYFVSLAPVGATELMIPAIAQAIGFAFSGAADPMMQLIRHLREKELLLVLDNFEHLLDGVALLGDMLQQAPSVQLLVTSRERLHLRGEWVLELQGLPVPDAEHADESAGAVTLFVERARRVQHDFALSAAEYPCVARICRLLGGLPLAIELAAAWVRVLSCEEIAQEVERSLDFLAMSTRDMPARHHSLRAVFDHSWNLLSDAEQRVLPELAVFCGDFSRDAAAQVAGASLPLLAALVDKSLLGRTAAGRYDMHNLIQQYADEQLRASGAANETHERHAAYYLALAEEAALQLRGAGQEIWRDRLEAEHDNLRAALAWSLAAPGGAETALRLAGALWHFWEIHSHFSEGRVWLERALERRSSVAAPVSAKALSGIGVLTEAQGVEVRAIALLEEALALWRELGDKPGMAEALLYLGRLARNQGDYPRARMREEESLALFQETGTGWGVVWSLLSLGDVALDQGHIAQAAAHFQGALAHSHEVPDRHATAWALRNLGLVAHFQGDNQRAAARFQEGLALFREMGSRWGTTEVLCDMGRMAHAQGEIAQAVAHYCESLALFRELEGKRLISVCLEGLAGLAGAQKQPERAARLFGAAEALRESAGPPLPPIYRADYHRDVAAARAQLEPARWTAAWAAGRVLPLEQAIAEALRRGTQCNW